MEFVGHPDHNNLMGGVPSSGYRNIMKIFLSLYFSRALLSLKMLHHPIFLPSPSSSLPLSHPLFYFSLFLLSSSPLPFSGKELLLSNRNDNETLEKVNNPPFFNFLFIAHTQY